MYDGRSFPEGVCIALQLLPASGADAGSAEECERGATPQTSRRPEAESWEERLMLLNGMMAGAPTHIYVLSMCALIVMWRLTWQDRWVERGEPEKGKWGGQIPHLVTDYSSVVVTL